MKEAKLLKGSVGRTLIKMKLPMAIGYFASMLFNIVDTLYISKLGVAPLAAMSFTFPVMLVVTSFAIGIGMGVTTMISIAIGENNQNKIKRYATDSLLLAVCITLLLSIVGYITIEPLFIILGADDEVLVLIKQYMDVWYMGVGFLAIPFVVNGAIRATGDMKTPSFLLIIAGIANIIISPLFIYGIWIFPRWEVMGAAFGTILSYLIVFISSLYILINREKMIDFKMPEFKQVWSSWKEVMYVGIPAIGTTILIPLSSIALTGVISHFGSSAVAALGVALRIENFSLIGISALSVVVIPFIGQNFGAKRYDRVHKAIHFSFKYSLFWGLLVAIILFVLSKQIAGLFSNDIEVVRLTSLYLKTIPFSYVFAGVIVVSSSVFNAIKKPLKSTITILIRLFVLSVPLAIICGYYYGVIGMFIGIAGANLISGLVSFIWVRRTQVKIGY